MRNVHVVATLVLITAIAGCDEDTKKKPAPAVAPPVSAADDVAHPSPAETSALGECNATRTREIVKAYNGDAKFTAAIRAANAYQAKCPRVAVLDWDLLYAEEHLEHWKQAEAITDRLVKEKPDDSDYWWWRGKDRGELGQHARAIADLRQSLAAATSTSNGVQIDPLDAAAKPAKQPCETAFALRWLSNLGVELVDSAQRQFNEVYLGQDCKRLDGHGKLAWTTGMKRTKLAGKLGGKPIKVMIDSGLGTTLVRRDLADAQKLARGAEVDVLTPTGLGVGATSAADLAVGGATVAAVPIAIVDTLPEGIDAVIGLSLLWRFDIKSDGQDMSATTPDHD